jgi:arylformamidase
MDNAPSSKVWLDYDQAELDRQYNQRSVVPDGDAYKAGDAEASERARAEFPCQEAKYGISENERLDYFPAAEPGAPVLVFLHGGAWTRGSKSNESFIAPEFLKSGAAVVCVDFSMAPLATLDKMVEQCRRAVAWVYTHAKTMNADPARLVIAGHSSGAHLAAMMLVTEWSGSRLPDDVIKGCVITSGMYDLTPVRLSFRNEYLHLDEAAVERLSPLRHLRAGLPPVAVFYGGAELAEFRRQNQDFVRALRGAGLTCEDGDLPGLNHFDMGRQLAAADSPVHKAARKMLGL